MTILCYIPLGGKHASFQNSSEYNGSGSALRDLRSAIHELDHQRNSAAAVASDYGRVRPLRDNLVFSKTDDDDSILLRHRSLFPVVDSRKARNYLGGDVPLHNRNPTLDQWGIHAFHRNGTLTRIEKILFKQETMLFLHNDTSSIIEKANKLFFIAVVLFALACFFIPQLQTLSLAITLMTIIIGVVSFNKERFSKSRPWWTFMTLNGFALYAAACLINLKCGTCASLPLLIPGLGLYYFGILRTIML